MKRHEYVEGPKATQNFEAGMKALFKVPKTVVEKAQKKARKKRAKKASGRGPSRDSGGEA